MPGGFDPPSGDGIRATPFLVGKIKVVKASFVKHPFHWFSAPSFGVNRLIDFLEGIKYESDGNK